MAAACRKSSNTATPQSKQRSQVRYGSIADISRNLFASSMFAREMKPASLQERVPIGLNRKRALDSFTWSHFLRRNRYPLSGKCSNPGARESGG